MSVSHVLVVDDEADIRALIQEILSDEGYDVTAAADANEARAARADKRFDLILLDIWMPDTDGITLLREWSEGGDLKCPVVIMSGHGTVDTAVEATRLGAYDFLVKPVDPKTVQALADRGLRFRREAAVTCKAAANGRGGAGVEQQGAGGSAQHAAAAADACGPQQADASTA